MGVFAMVDESPQQKPGSSRELRGCEERVLVVGEDQVALQQIKNRVAGLGGHVEQVSDPGSACKCLNCTHWDVVAPIIRDSEEGRHELRWWVDLLRDLENPPRLVPASPASSPQALISQQIPEAPSRRAPRSPALAPSAYHVSQNADAVIPLMAVRSIAVGCAHLVADSPAMQQVYRTITQVAPSSATVLLTGESGTGKELAARVLHQLSQRARGPFVVVNCAAIPVNLLESELFGHERGAFSGAVSRQIGRWERADGGTLFLDEIGDLELQLQGKILRAIQEREIERVGSGCPKPVNVRIVAATNRDLRLATAQGRFREDLYYRLAVISIQMPRLVERSDDLLMLTSHYLRLFAEKNGTQVRGMTAGALNCLRQHSWPGNIRELQNVLESGVLHMTGDTLGVEHLPAYLRPSEAVEVIPTADSPPAFLSLSELEARYIGNVLRHTRGQMAEAARVLGIHRNTLRRKIRDYGIAAP
jgi:DNA-binding NtrC family response regulator